MKLKAIQALQHAANRKGRDESSLNPLCRPTCSLPRLLLDCRMCCRHQQTYTIWPIFYGRLTTRATSWSWMPPGFSAWSASCSR